MKTVTGMFVRSEDAERALDALKSAGFHKDKTGLLVREPFIHEHIGGATESTALKSGAKGVVRGAAWGGLTGLLAGVAAIAIPGLGPVFATGVVASALAGAAEGVQIGAMAGGLLSALGSLDITEEDSNFCAEGVKRCGILLAVRTDDAEADTALRILQESGAVDAEEHRRSWVAHGWHGKFRETQPEALERYRDSWIDNIRPPM
jgi:hypothetical protein